MKKISLLVLAFGFASTCLLAEEAAEIKVPPAPAPAPAAPAPAVDPASAQPAKKKKHGKGGHKHGKKHADPAAPDAPPKS